MINRIMCRDQYGGVRFRPGKGTPDALQAIKDLQDHPRYGKWARRAVDRDSKGQSRLRPPELDIIRVTDRLYEIEDHIHSPPSLPRGNDPRAKPYKALPSMLPVPSLRQYQLGCVSD